MATGMAKQIMTIEGGKTIHHGVIVEDGQKLQTWDLIILHKIMFEKVENMFSEWGSLGFLGCLSGFLDFPGRAPAPRFLARGWESWLVAGSRENFLRFSISTTNSADMDVHTHSAANPLQFLLL